MVTNANFDIYGDGATRLLGTNYYDKDCGDRVVDGAINTDDDVSFLATTACCGIAASLLDSDLPPRDLPSERALWDGVKPSWSDNEVPAGVQPGAFNNEVVEVTRPIRRRSCLVDSISNLTQTTRSSTSWPPAEGMEQTIRARADAAECRQLELAGRAARQLHGDAHFTSPRTHSGGAQNTTTMADEVCITRN